MDLISTELRTEIEAQLENIFDSFKRSYTLTFVKEGEIIIIDTPDYSPSDAPPEASEETLEVEARIWYVDERDESYYPSAVINRERIAAGQDATKVKIQVRIEHYDFLKSAKKFILEGETYYPEDTPKKIGMLAEFQKVQVILRKEK